MARPRKPMNAAQRALMDAVCGSGDLIFSNGGDSVSANLVGTFTIRRYGEEDRLDVGDCTHHAHIDWDLVTRAEIGTSRGEGLITFWNGTDLLFEMFRPAGPFPQDVVALAGELRAPS
ncbi:MAG: hypothetical protein AAF563_12470 [Pseudomonadota bacterium]